MQFGMRLAVSRWSAIRSSRTIAALLLALPLTFGAASSALAQSDPGGLSFRACWSYCAPNASRSDQGACNACLRRVCAQQPRLRSHPACQRVSRVEVPEVEAEEPEPIASPAPRAPASCDVAACSARYRTFRPSDCTYQPFDGPRRLCTRKSDPAVDTAVQNTAETESESETAFIDDELDIDPTVDEAPALPASDQLGCDYQACEERYRSFRRSDCTYQPFEGPRRRCTRGDPIGAAAREAAARAAAEAADNPDDGTAPLDDGGADGAQLSAAAEEAEAEARARARASSILPADLEADGTYEKLANFAAPITYSALAFIALLRVLFMRGAPAPGGSIETPPAQRGRPSPLLKETREGWRIERTSRAAFGASGKEPPPEDFGRS